MRTATVAVAAFVALIVAAPASAAQHDSLVDTYKCAPTWTVHHVGGYLVFGPRLAPPPASRVIHVASPDGQTVVALCRR